MRLGRELHATPDELMDRLTVADLIEQMAYDVLVAEEAEEWRRQAQS